MAVHRFLILSLFQIACIAGVACHNSAFQTIPVPKLKYAGEEKMLPGQQEAQRAYVEKIKETYLVDVSNVPTKVYWVKPTPCPDPSSEKDGLYYNVKGDREGCYWGLTFACSEIYAIETDNLSESALIHELGHCYYIHVFGVKDTDHTDAAWWSLVETVNDSLENPLAPK